MGIHKKYVVILAFFLRSCAEIWSFTSGQWSASHGYWKFTKGRGWVEHITNASLSWLVVHLLHLKLFCYFFYLLKAPKLLINVTGIFLPLSLLKIGLECAGMCRERWTHQLHRRNVYYGYCSITPVWIFPSWLCPTLCSSTWDSPVNFPYPPGKSCVLMYAVQLIQGLVSKGKHEIYYLEVVQIFSVYYDWKWAHAGKWYPFRYCHTSSWRISSSIGATASCTPSGSTSMFTVFTMSVYHLFSASRHTFLNITDVLVNFSSWLYIRRTSKYLVF